MQNIRVKMLALAPGLQGYVFFTIMPSLRDWF